MLPLWGDHFRTDARLRRASGCRNREDLYIAISTDTGNFTYSNTGRKSLAYVSELVELFDLRATADVLFRRRSLLATRLIGQGDFAAGDSTRGKIASVTLLDSDMKEFGATGADCESIVDYAREIGNTDRRVFRELPKLSKSAFAQGRYRRKSGGRGIRRRRPYERGGLLQRGKLDEVKKAVLDKLWSWFNEQVINFLKPPGISSGGAVAF